MLSQDPDAVGLLPQPFVTVAMAQIEGLEISLDLTEEWEALSGAGSLVTGVTVTRSEFLETQEEAVTGFLEDHEASAAFTNESPQQAAELIADLGIVSSAQVAEQAIPYCNITCIRGEEMKTMLEGYLTALYDMDAQSVGGALPDEEFYYIPETDYE
jgi:NitT/TauT family transport system substrate-binding protein